MAMAKAIVQCHTAKQLEHWISCLARSRMLEGPEAVPDDTFETISKRLRTTIVLVIHPDHNHDHPSALNLFTEATGYFVECWTKWQEW